MGKDVDLPLLDLRAVGQPAEERIGGARAMLKDRLYERFGVPDQALALHVSAGSPAGSRVAISIQPASTCSPSCCIHWL